MSFINPVLRYSFPLWNQKIFCWLSLSVSSLLFSPIFVYKSISMKPSVDIQLCFVYFGHCRSNREVAYNGNNTGFRIRPSGNKIPTSTSTTYVIFASYLKYLNFNSSYTKSNTLYILVLWLGFSEVKHVEGKACFLFQTDDV